MSGLRTQQLRRGVDACLLTWSPTSSLSRSHVLPPLRAQLLARVSATTVCTIVHVKLYKLINTMPSTQGALLNLSSWYQTLIVPEPLQFFRCPALVSTMATPPPGYVRDLAGAFDQAGAPTAGAAPGVSITPAAPVPAAPPAPPAAPAPPVPASTALFIPPAPVFPFATAPAAPVPAPSPLSAVYINQHVPVVLSLNPSNYSPWRTMFELAFAKFGVLDHILGARVPLTRSGCRTTRSSLHGC